MSDHDSPPISRDNQPGTVLLRLLAGGMSVLLMAITAYTVLAVPPEWSYYYLSSLVFTPFMSIVLLLAALRGDSGQKAVQETPSVTEAGPPAHLVLRVVAGVLGLLLGIGFTVGTYYDFLHGESHIFSPLPLMLIIPAILLECAVTGRKVVRGGFVDRNWTIFLIASGIGTSVDAIRDGEASGFVFGITIFCFFLYIALRQYLEKLLLKRTA